MGSLQPTFFFVPKVALLASPTSLLEMPILRPHPSFRNSEDQPINLCFSEHFMPFWCTLNFENRCKCYRTLNLNWKIIKLKLGKKRNKQTMETSFLTVLEVGVPRLGYQHGKVLVKALPLRYGWFPSYFVLTGPFFVGAQRMRANSLFSLLIRALVHYENHTLMISSNPNCFQSPPFQIPWHLELGLQLMNFGGTQTFSP